MCIYIKLTTVLNGAKLTRLIVTMITVGNMQQYLNPILIHACSCDFTTYISMLRY